MLTICSQYIITLILRCIDRRTQVDRLRPFFILQCRIHDVITSNAVVTFRTEEQCDSIGMNEWCIVIESGIDAGPEVDSLSPASIGLFFTYINISSTQAARTFTC